MKRAPRSRQRHDLYAKYHDYDSEISDLLGECGRKVVPFIFSYFTYFIWFINRIRFFGKSSHEHVPINLLRPQFRSIFPNSKQSIYCINGPTNI